jgi:hypothetical protein
MRIYVASSWRNAYQQSVVKLLRHLGHDVYDFRNPAPGNSGFAWSAIDPNWQSWTPDAYRKALKNSVAKGGYALDIGAVRWCDAGPACWCCHRDVRPHGNSGTLWARESRAWSTCRSLASRI